MALLCLHSRLTDAISRPATLRAGALLALVAGVAAAAEPPRTPVVSPAEVPAVGRQEAILTTAGFGRYAITAASPQGTALQLIDRMSGPGEVAGVAGERNGRLDVFLDRGEYKVLALSHERGSGKATLAVHAFSELHAPQPPRLVELKPVDEALDDLQQLSYWLEVTEQRVVAFEAAGRSLADLRLWQSGTWLVDVAPTREVVQPRPGKPLVVFRLVADLPPGLYMLSAYGGPAQPWAEDDGSHPFHLHFGIPTLPEAARQRFTVGPLGIDRYLIPGSTTYVRLELPEARPALLRVGAYNDHRPYAEIGEVREIDKNSLPPVAEIFVGSSSRPRVVTVTGEAGQPYVLQEFVSGRTFAFSESGPRWLATIHSGHAADSVDATALVTRSQPFCAGPEVDAATGHQRPFLSKVIEIDALHGWARRCNLLDALTVFLRIQTTGQYEVLSHGVPARFRIEPFMVSVPEHYKAPEFQPSPSLWDLDAGFYVLTAEPVKKGIVDIVVKSKGLVDKALDLVGGEFPVAQPALQAACTFPDVVLDADRCYTIYINDQPGVRTGLVLRALPLDLTESLPVAQAPDEKISAPFTAAEAGTVRAQAEDGSLLEISVDGGPWEKQRAVDPGGHTVAVRNTGKDTVLYSLSLTPTRLAPDTPLPPIPDSLLAGLPKFPVLLADAPHVLDLARRERATVLVRADRPALYRLESDGLLATSGTVRTRTIPELDRESGNGVGRNFLIQQYLREGDYQLTVNTEGASAGHLALRLGQAPLVDGGELVDGLPARAMLGTGEGIVYRFHVDQAGEYRLHAFGLDRTFSCRLEDGDGWPIERPGITAAIDRHFEPGTYRIVVLPSSVPSRCITLLERTPQPLHFTGHGPHSLPLGGEVEHLWTEPEVGAERVPDQWDLDVPAPVHATVSLSSEMRADILLVKPDGSTEKRGEVTPGRAWHGLLDIGHWRLAVTCAHANNLVSYRLAVATDELVAGQRRDIVAPLSVPLSVGRDGLVELSSFGSLDVRARLFDPAGHLVAANDDRPDDWNFQIARHLAAGVYRLRVDPVGASSAACAVTMDAPAEVEEPELALPASRQLAPGQATHVISLRPTPGDEVLLVAVRSKETVACQVEANEGASWHTVAAVSGRSPDLELLIPAGDDRPSRLRLRLWSVDRRGGSLTLEAATARPPRAHEDQLAKGVALTAVTGMPSLGVALVDLVRPGVVALDDGPSGLRWAAGAGTQTRTVEGPYPAGASPLLLVADTTGARVRAHRVRLTSGPEHAVSFSLAGAAPVACDLAGSTGPVLVTATSTTGQPGVRIVEERDARSPSASGATMAVGHGSAVSVVLVRRASVAIVWRAGGDEDPIEVRLEETALREDVPTTPGWGAWSGTLAAATARSVILPPGPKRIRLALGRSTVAVLADDTEVRSVHWGGGEPLAETVTTTASRLVVLHGGTGNEPFNVEILAPLKGGEGGDLSPDKPFESVEVARGVRRLAVADETSGAGTIHVRGGDGEATVIAANGQVERGRDLAVPAGGGTLLIPHGPGRLLAWREREGGLGQALWGLVGELLATKVTGPSLLALSGTTEMLDVDFGRPAMLHVRTASPLAARLVRPDGAPRVEVYADGCSLDAYLPTGKAQLGLRALGGAELTGQLAVTDSPVDTIGEGLGPEVMLAPGETRAFSFRVDVGGPIGVGVRASSDVVACELLDAEGGVLGRGVVQMANLEPGTYLLALQAPADGAPVRVRPAVAGLAPPPTGPPEELVRCYLLLDQGKVSTCGGHTSAPATPPPAQDTDSESPDDPEGL
jgi:hypothetical protein